MVHPAGHTHRTWGVPPKSAGCCRTRIFTRESVSDGQTFQVHAAGNNDGRLTLAGTCTLSNREGWRWRRLILRWGRATPVCAARSSKAWARRSVGYQTKPPPGTSIRPCVDLQSYRRVLGCPLVLPWEARQGRALRTSIQHVPARVPVRAPGSGQSAPCVDIRLPVPFLAGVRFFSRRKYPCRLTLAMEFR